MLSDTQHRNQLLDASEVLRLGRGQVNLHPTTWSQIEGLSPLTSSAFAPGPKQMDFFKMQPGINLRSADSQGQILW